MDAAQRAQVHQWVRETLATLGETRLLIHVEFNDSFTRRMGDAHRDRSSGKMIIRLSVPLWPHATEAQRKETVVHEVCHIVDMARGTYQPGEAHGFSWGRLMIQCGYAPRRCHDVQRPAELKRKVQRFEAKCSCSTHQITSNRRTKMLSGNMRYRCLKCNTTLSLVW